MLWTRIASGVVLAPLFLALVYWGYPTFHIMVGLITAVITWEFVRMDSTLSKMDRTLLLAAGWLGALLIPVAAPWAMILVVLSMGFLFLRRGEPVYLAPSYAVLPAVTLAYIWAVGGYVSIYWVLAVVWATDIGAYAVGRLAGGPKLAPAISPNKTWSGAVGGLVAAVICAGLLLVGFGYGVSPAAVGVSILMSIISQCGDLFESALKRRFNVKDSGGLIPGHGGFMDRFDGLWAAAPIAAVFCVLLGGGVQRW